MINQILVIIEILPLIQFLALFFLLLITGVFWGLWFSLSRSYHLFSISELAHIGKVIIKNLAFPMRFLSMFCIAFMILSVCIYPQKESLGFYLSIASVVLILSALLITVIVEVPINNQVISWTSDTAPSNREEIINRWQLFNIIRTLAALLSFACFTAALIIPS